MPAAIDAVTDLETLLDVPRECLLVRIGGCYHLHFNPDHCPPGLFARARLLIPAGFSFHVERPSACDRDVGEVCLSYREPA